jgi:hypothetical protein
LIKPLGSLWQPQCHLKHGLLLRDLCAQHFGRTNPPATEHDLHEHFQFKNSGGRGMATPALEMKTFVVERHVKEQASDGQAVPVSSLSRAELIETLRQNIVVWTSWSQFSEEHSNLSNEFDRTRIGSSACRAAGKFTDN